MNLNMNSIKSVRHRMGRFASCVTKKTWPIYGGRRCSLCVKILLLVLAVCYSFSQLFWGLDYTDSFYYLDIFKSREIDWMIVGFQMLGRLWINCFGDSLIALRICNWLFYAISFILAYWWFVPKESHKTFLGFLSLPFLLLPTFSLNIFNGDSCTLLMCICISKLLMDWMSSSSKKVALTLFFVMLLAFVFRFPNVVILPITVIVVLLFHRNKRKLIEYFAVCLCVSIVYCLIVSLLKDGGSILNEGSHSIKSLLVNYLRDGKMLLRYIPVCMLLVIISFAKIKRQLVRVCVDIMLVIFLLIYLYYNVDFGFACWNISLFISSFLISLYVYLIFKWVEEFDDKFFSDRGLLLIILPLMALVNPAGSDTGFLKLIWVLLSTIPFLAYNVGMIVKSKVLIFVVSVFVLICLLGHYKNPFGEPSLIKLKYSIDNSQLVGIRTCKEYFDVYENLKNDIQDCEDDDVVVYGERSYGLCELLDIERLFHSSFFMNPDEESEVRIMEDCISKHSPVVFFMPYNPLEAKEIFDWRHDLTKMEYMMFSKGYKEMKRTDYYIIYEKNN